MLQNLQTRHTCRGHVEQNNSWYSARREHFQIQVPQLSFESRSCLSSAHHLLIDFQSPLEQILHQINTSKQIFAKTSTKQQKYDQVLLLMSTNCNANRLNDWFSRASSSTIGKGISTFFVASFPPYAWCMSTLCSRKVTLHCSWFPINPSIT